MIFNSKYKLQKMSECFNGISSNIYDGLDELVRILDVNEIFDTAISKILAVSELLVKQIYVDIHKDNSYLTLSKMISELYQNMAVIPEEMYSILTLIRIYGNKTKHGGQEIEYIQEDFKMVLEGLIRFTTWYLTEFPKGPLLDKIYFNQKNDKKKILIWSDISYTITQTIANKIANKISFEDKNNFDFAVLKNGNELLQYELNPEKIKLIILVITDVTKLSDDEKIREKINKDLEHYVTIGGAIIGTHDIIYRRTRNTLLQKVFGCELTDFERVDKPIKYIKNKDEELPESFVKLEDEFTLSDGEISKGNWDPVCKVIYKSEEDIPLVVVREYGDGGKLVWLNSGEHKDFPPKSIALPEKHFVSLINASIEYILNK